MKTIIFLDMDGVLADFEGGIQSSNEGLDKMFDNGFFKTLLPLERDLETTIKKLQILAEVKVVSKACVPKTDSRYQKQVEDKVEWLRIFAPTIPRENIMVLASDESKGMIAQKYKSTNAILVDDYSKNLVEWELAGGVGVKRAKRFKERRFEQVRNLRQLIDLLEEVL